MMVHLQPDGVANVATAILFVVIDSLAVVLRLISKRKTKHFFSSDDQWILCALVLFFGWAGQIIYSMVGIAGTLEVANLKDPQELEKALKVLWAAEFFFPLTITPVKLSVLSFYRTIFSTRRFRLATYAISAICVMWLFAGFWVILFQCHPVRAVFDVRLAAEVHCFPFAAFVFTYELINALIDVSILALPIFMVRKLQMKTKRKLQVISIFLMGGFVLITCILRMVYSFNPKKLAAVPSYPQATLWSTIELGTAILCACLPTYRPLLAESFRLAAPIRSWYNSLLSATGVKSAGSSKGPSNHGRSAFVRFDRHGLDSMDEHHLTQAIGKAKGEQETYKSPSYPMNAISVQSRVEIV